jgi:hypothetical protein
MFFLYLVSFISFLTFIYKKLTTNDYDYDSIEESKPIKQENNELEEDEWLDLVDEHVIDAYWFVKKDTNHFNVLPFHIAKWAKHMYNARVKGVNNPSADCLDQSILSLSSLKDKDNNYIFKEIMDFLYYEDLIHYPLWGIVIHTKNETYVRWNKKTEGNRLVPWLDIIKPKQHNYKIHVLESFNHSHSNKIQDLLVKLYNTKTIFLQDEPPQGVSCLDNDLLSFLIEMDPRESEFSKSESESEIEETDESDDDDKSDDDEETDDNEETDDDEKNDKSYEKLSIFELAEILHQQSKSLLQVKIDTSEINLHILDNRPRDCYIQEKFKVFCLLALALESTALESESESESDSGANSVTICWVIFVERRPLQFLLSILFSFEVIKQSIA